MRVLLIKYELSYTCLYHRSLHYGLYLCVCVLCLYYVISTSLEIGTQRPLKNLKKKCIGNAAVLLNWYAVDSNRILYSVIKDLFYFN